MWINDVLFSLPPHSASIYANKIYVCTEIYWHVKYTVSPRSLDLFYLVTYIEKGLRIE